MAEEGSSNNTTASSNESIIMSQIRAEKAAKAIEKYENEREIEERLKKKIIEDMLSSTRDDTTQLILDKAEEALVNAREFIENFLGFNNSNSALADLWAKVQQILNMLDPFTQLPGVVIPGVGDVTGIVEEFIMMQKIIWDVLPAEQKEQIRKKIKEEKKSKKKPGIIKKMGQELENQADQTWDAVQILIDEIPRIKEDLYMMCLENSWGLIVKICKMLGIPIDVFPFNLLAEMPEINKLARDLRRNGKQMIKDAFTDMMAPLYIGRSMLDSVPTTNEIKLSAVCISLVENSYQLEYQRIEQKLADLELRKLQLERQISDLKDKLKYTEKRLNSYSDSSMTSFQEMFETVKKESEQRLSSLNKNVEKIENEIPLETTARDFADAKRKNKDEIKKVAQVDFDKLKLMVDEKNAETAKIQKSIEDDVQKRREYIKKKRQSKKNAAVEGTDSANPSGDGDEAALGDDTTSSVGAPKNPVNMTQAESASEDD